MAGLEMKFDHDTTEEIRATVTNTDGGGAVQSEAAQSPRYWYIGIVNNRHEKKVAGMVRRDFPQTEAYVPVRRETRTWSKGRKREVEMVVIPAKLFVHATEEERLSILKHHVGVSHFMVDAAKQLTAHSMHPIARVPEEQMAQLRLMLEYSPTPVEFSECHFAKGDKVRVVSGPLKSLEGIVCRNTHGKPRIYITIEALGSANTEIDITAIEKIESL